MKVKLTALALILALLSAVVLVPTSARAQRPAVSPPTATVTGSFVCSAAGVPSSVCTTAGQVVNYSTVFTITSFALNSARQLVANVTATTTLTDALTGNTLGTVTQTFSNVLVTTGQTCPILHLDIGPITLNLLGLMVTTNQIVIDITAVSGPGNLLGNLLCAVAHLLDSNASLTALNNLIAHLNAILAGL